MLFHQFAFLFMFLPAVLAGDRLLQARVRARGVWLLVASVTFYVSGSMEFLPILAGTIVVDYVVGGRIAASGDPKVRRRWLWCSIVSNLGVLVLFKYAAFLTGSLRTVLGERIPLIALPLPVGISFYTFQSMSYTIDIYRHRVRPARSLGEFATFVTLFPQLIAGPIVRWADLRDQMVSRDDSSDRFAWGILILVVGLGKKVILADTFAAAAAPIFASHDLGMVAAWTAMVLYAGQIYFDFSGYSDMAVGLGAMLGFSFPRNFNSPYRATSFSDFWRRWHITLSNWLRDYLYIPLGGNRNGALRTYANLVATMLIGGLWHGASWNFVVWGAIHGTALALERLLGDPLQRVPAWCRRVVVVAVVTLAWVPFRSEDLAETVTLWRSMFGFHGLGSVSAYPLIAALAAMGVASLTVNSGGWRHDHFDARKLAFAVIVLVGSVCLGYGRLDVSPFLYFRF